ncbi:hypothetical protein [Bacillus sp. ISTL8]|uniref:hypothetical protein n=1 Tax=Bacillus sp. ISTL8 TaxID=2596896 RepID=UPI001456FA46|nr:hypothetical protein [Bacillus sp. ISTL8]
MSKVAYYEDKIERAELKVEKCNGTIERHKKQLEKKIQAVVKAVGIDLTGKSKEEIDEMRDPYRGTDASWTIYEVMSKLDDIKGAKKKLSEAEIILSNWRTKLDAEINKENFIRDNAPQVIKDFLEEWKELAYKWHIKRYEDYQGFKVELKKKVFEAQMKCIKTLPVYAEYLDENGEVQEKYKDEYYLANIHPWNPMKAYLEERDLDYSGVQARKTSYAGAIVFNMDTMSKPKRLEYLEKTLEHDKQMKMFDLIQRITKAVGEITDASGLKINQKGCLDGLIIGDKGKARLETIGAGGWNIVCFHYRTLVKPVKE